MSDSKTNKCSHQPCVCVPSAGEKYCSQFCKDAARKKLKSPAIAAMRPAPSNQATTNKDSASASCNLSQIQEVIFYRPELHLT